MKKTTKERGECRLYDCILIKFKVRQICGVRNQGFAFGREEEADDVLGVDLAGGFRGVYAF